MLVGHERPDIVAADRLDLFRDTETTMHFALTPVPGRGISIGVHHSLHFLPVIDVVCCARGAECRSHQVAATQFGPHARSGPCRGGLGLRYCDVTTKPARGKWTQTSPIAGSLRRITISCT